MRSGPLPATPALLRTGLRASALALTALLLAGAAPAEATSSVCESVVGVGIVCFDEDLGTGTTNSDLARDMFVPMLVNPGTEILDVERSDFNHAGAKPANRPA